MQLTTKKSIPLSPSPKKKQEHFLLSEYTNPKKYKVKQKKGYSLTTRINNNDNESKEELIVIKNDSIPNVYRNDPHFHLFNKYYKEQYHSP